MTYTLVSHLRLVMIGDHLRLQISLQRLLSKQQIESWAPGSSTPQVEMCSDCLTILRRPGVASLVWPLGTARGDPDQPHWSCHLCDQKGINRLIAIGVLKKNSPLSAP